jgi:hypothetical protein
MIDAGPEMKEIRVQLIDITGKTVYSGQDLLVNTEEIRSGIYFLRMTSGSNIIVTKLIKK